MSLGFPEVQPAVVNEVSGVWDGVPMMGVGGKICHLAMDIVDKGLS